MATVRQALDDLNQRLDGPLEKLQQLDEFATRFDPSGRSGDALTVSGGPGGGGEGGNGFVGGPGASGATVSGGSGGGGEGGSSFLVAEETADAAALRAVNLLLAELGLPQTVALANQVSINDGFGLTSLGGSQPHKIRAGGS